MTHLELLQAVFPLFLRVLQKDPSFRPTFTVTALSYWLADRDVKMTYRPGRQSRYSEFIRAALAAASKEEKESLKEILRLQDNFLPLSQ